MQRSIIYCTSCGASNPAGAAFCFQCGKPLQTNAPSNVGYGSEPQPLTQYANSYSPPPEYQTPSTPPGAYPTYTPPTPPSPKKSAISQRGLFIGLGGLILVGIILVLLFVVVLRHPSYPQLASSYSGSLSACPTNCTTLPLKLSSVVEDQQGNISGTITSSGTSGDSTSLPFKGTVTTNNRITFSVSYDNGNGITSFVGTIFSDGHLAGQWTQKISNGYQDNGNWNASPT
jgi:zinc-ribbon domain